MKESPPYTLEDFAGRWTLTRKIIQQNGDVFTFSGEAEFSWLNGNEHKSEGHKNRGSFQEERSALAYFEKGEVIAPNGSVMPAERRYFWQQPQTGFFEVLFDDKRYFHTFSAANPSAEHLCGDDNYVVRYDFTAWPVWRSTWQVIGPRKDYTMVSEYSPV